MTAAELKSILGLLGLDPPWLAAKMGVALRSVWRWCDGDSPVPVFVIEAIKQVMVDTAEETHRMWTAARGSTPTADIILYTYRTDKQLTWAPYPASWHRMLTARLMDNLLSTGQYKVTVEYAD